MRFKFSRSVFSIFLFAISLFLLTFAVHKKAYAANTVSNADNGNGSVNVGTNVKIKKIEKKLDKALLEIQSIKKESKAQNSENYFSNMQLLGTLIASYTYNLAKPETYNTPSSIVSTILEI